MSFKKYCLFLLSFAVVLGANPICDATFCSSGCCTHLNTCTSTLAADCAVKQTDSIDCSSDGQPDNTKCPIPYSCRRTTNRCAKTLLIAPGQTSFNTCSTASDCFNAQYSAAQCKVYCASAIGLAITDCLVNCKINYACQEVSKFVTGDVCQKCDPTKCTSGCCDKYDNTCVSATSDRCDTNGGAVSCNQNSDCTSSSKLAGDSSQYECNQTSKTCTLQCQYDPLNINYAFCKSLINAGEQAGSLLTMILWIIFGIICFIIVVVLICCFCCCAAVADASQVHVRRVGNGQGQQSNQQMQQNYQVQGGVQMQSMQQGNTQQSYTVQQDTTMMQEIMQ